MSDYKDFFQEQNDENDSERGTSLNRFEKMLRSNSNYFFDIDEFETIIEHYLVNFNYQDAAKAVRIGMHQHPESLQLKLRKAQLHVINGQPIEAMDIIKQLDKHMPTYPDVLYLKGFAYTQLGQYDSAILSYNELLRHPVSDAIQLIQKIAESFLYNDQFDIALVYIEKGLKINSSDSGLIYNAAYCYHHKKDFHNSLFYYKLYLDEDPFDSLVWTYVSLAYNELERYDKAIEACDYAIALDDKLSSAYYNKGNALAAMGKMHDAINSYNDCLFCNSEENAEIYCCLGECYEQLNNDSLAIDNYRRAIELDSEFSDAWYGLAMVAYKKNNYDDCLKTLKKALYIQPDNSDYWFSLGNLYSQTEDQKKAVEAFKKAIELNPEDFESWINLSDLYFKKNMLTKAIKTMNESYVYTSDVPIVNFRLAAYYYLKGDNRIGLKYFKKGMQLNVTDHDEFLKICPDALSFPEIKKLITLKTTDNK